MTTLPISPTTSIAAITAMTREDISLTVPLALSKSRQDHVLDLDLSNPDLLNREQCAILSLWQTVNASLSAYYKLLRKFESPANALKASTSQWEEIGIHTKHIERHRDIVQNELFMQKAQNDLIQNNYQIIFINGNDYPVQLKSLFDPPPLLFVRGNITQLNTSQIAIVGSRKPTPHAQKITFDMAQYLAQSGYVITSGLAQGIDNHAHLGALSQMNTAAKGRTVGVLGTGINVIYPKSHGELFQKIINDGGCLVTELLPDTPASKHTFPRRNRLVAGLSLGTIVTEATINSGSLITARLTSEQGKQVFAIPSHIDNINAMGCHHLIREGATLIYHPDQVIEDLQYQGDQSTRLTSVLQNSQNNSDSNGNIKSNPTRDNNSPHDNFNSTTPTPFKVEAAVIHPTQSVDVPTHLQILYEHLDWSGIYLDTLLTNLSLDTQTLLGQLMELELLGLITQQSGKYLRV